MKCQRLPNYRILQLVGNYPVSGGPQLALLFIATAELLNITSLLYSFRIWVCVLKFLGSVAELLGLRLIRSTVFVGLYRIR